ncbi:60S ribosomal protein L18a-like protein [Prunus yedoensis var. nudiflora]|uniref:60S ribosomal protein L18a-like protein n=1 Tax=Prunus yedoensis var. nudiflora TaxID=2094558 RepID=A0A314YH83_PRUYE|nr:60S ribosomal protein L18a-like protein [Prunus yedoensis var. nudiflora]
MSDDSKTRGLGGDQQSQQYYGTFQGVANYYPTVPPPPPEPVVGFPQPVPPPGSTGRPPLPPHHQHHHHHHHHRGYQTVTGYAVVEGRPVRERRLPCCGMGIGWLLFIIGFFLGGIPWYVGTFILLCVRVDYREKPGYVACTIASILVVIAVTLGATNGARTW